MLVSHFEAPLACAGAPSWFRFPIITPAPIPPAACSHSRRFISAPVETQRATVYLRSQRVSDTDHKEHQPFRSQQERTERDSRRNQKPRTLKVRLHLSGRGRLSLAIARLNRSRNMPTIKTNSRRVFNPLPTDKERTQGRKLRISSIGHQSSAKAKKA